MQDTIVTFDGTKSDVIVASFQSSPGFLVAYNGTIYFSASADVAGRELWRYDGTNNTRVTDMNPSGDSTPGGMTVINGILNLSAIAGTGFGLCKYEGTG